MQGLDFEPNISSSSVLYFLVLIVIIYNYGLHDKLISIVIKLRKGYFPEIRRKITLSQFNNYGY